MKKYILLSSLFISPAIYSQIPEDAIRYSFYPQSGTARNLSIGGAMGSLGGDVNATFVNPAGLGFYKTSEFVLTPSVFFNNNKSNFRESSFQNKTTSFNIGTNGGVIGFNSRSNSKITNAVSFAITQTANFNNTIQYRGLNNYSSFSEQFAEEFAKSGYTIDEALNNNSPLPYTTAPALYTYLIDTVTINGVKQVKGAPEYILDAGSALMQEMKKTTKGGITELAIGFARNNNDKFYWGVTLGLPFVNYNSNTYFKESDTSANTDNHFNQFEYTDNFKTTGVGINGKLGIIYKPKEYIRLGIAVHTPTYMNLSDERTTNLSTQLENPISDFTISSTLFTNNQPGKSKYIQTTPLKVLLSASYVFREVADVKRQKGFITADIEYVNHKGSRFAFDSENDNVTPDEKEYYKLYYKQLNNVIKANYKGAFNFRVGGELKYNTLMGRLGFAYYGNPYKDAAYKASNILLSGGLGYRNKGIFADLTYVHSFIKDVNFPYRLQDKANTFATLKQQRGNVVATIGFKF